MLFKFYFTSVKKKKKISANFWSKYENKEKASNWHWERQSSICRKRKKNNKNIQPAGECHMNRAAKTMLSLLQVLGTTCKHPHKQHECLPSNIIKCAVKWFRLIGRGGTSLPSYCSTLWTKRFRVFVNLFTFLVLDVVMWPIYSQGSEMELPHFSL